MPVTLWDESTWDAYMVTRIKVTTLLMTHRVAKNEQHRAQMEPQAVHSAATGARHRAGRDAHALEPLPMTRSNPTTESPFVLLVALGDNWHGWYPAVINGYAALKLRPC